MQFRVAITDNHWFDQLRAMAARDGVDECNFWLPSGRGVQAQTGELILFKLHAPRNVIAGGGYVSRVSKLSVQRAWDAFGPLNGTTSQGEMRDRVAHYRKANVTTTMDHEVTAVILGEPFFFADGDSVPVPPDFSRHIQVTKIYDTDNENGRRLWRQVGERLQGMPNVGIGPAQIQLREFAAFGPPRLVAPRLGQGGFRIGVLENYRRRCVITGERTEPVLEAAHIRRYSESGGHDLANGLLLRSDLHRLFDLGYIGVEPEKRSVLVSSKIRERFENGRAYYALHGTRLALPVNPATAPDPNLLRFHLERVFVP